jgi:nucleoid-associated protein YgaU
MCVARQRAGGLAAVENSRQGRVRVRRVQARERVAGGPARTGLRVVRPGERRSLYLIGGAQREVRSAAEAGRAGPRKVSPPAEHRRESRGTGRPLRAVAPSAHSDSGRRAPVRLTRRGRLVMQLAVVTLASLAFAGVAAASKASPGVWTTRGDHAVVVHEGDTLWTIAARQVPGGDRREVVEAIRQLNGLNGTRIEVGQQLILPSR